MKSARARVQRAISGISTTSTTNEKDVHYNAESIISSGNVTPDGLEPQEYDAKATKRLLRKQDWHIIPFMSLIYLYVHLSLRLQKLVIHSCRRATEELRTEL